MSAKKPIHATEITTKILADGQWHDYSKTVSQASREIPPHVAVHFGELQRSRVYRAKHGVDPPPRVVQLTAEELVMYGARLLVRRSLLNSPRFEHGRHEETKQHFVRLRTRLVEPPPGDPKIIPFLPNPAKGVPVVQRSVEEQKRLKKAAVEKGLRTAYLKRGIDPDTHVTRREQDRQRAERYQSMTPEERAAFNSERSRRGWARRKAQLTREEDE